jgi:hypothetical protein
MAIQQPRRCQQPGAQRQVGQPHRPCHFAQRGGVRLLAGLLLIWLALPTGTVKNHYGACDRILYFRPRPAALVHG